MSHKRLVFSAVAVAAFVGASVGYFVSRQDAAGPFAGFAASSGVSGEDEAAPPPSRPFGDTTTSVGGTAAPTGDSSSAPGVTEPSAAALAQPTSTFASVGALPRRLSEASSAHSAVAKSGSGGSSDSPSSLNLPSSNPPGDPEISLAVVAPSSGPVIESVRASPATQQGSDVRPFIVTEVPPSIKPIEKTFLELVVSANSPLGLQIETTLSSDSAYVEERVEARVTNDVKVGDRVAIPSGTKAIGTVTLVVKGGKIREQAKLDVRFHTLSLVDGISLRINTDLVHVEGPSPSEAASSKIGGGAIAGAILGAIFGGARGMAAGAAAGGGAGVAAAEAGKPSVATLSAGSTVSVRLAAPVTVTVEQ